MKIFKFKVKDITSLIVQLLWICLCMMPLGLLAQTFPVDAASGKIYYAEEVLVKDGPQLDLYNRAKTWLAAGNQKKALQVEDAANGILIKSNYSLLSVHDGNTFQTFKLWYSIKIEVADDRYWYSLSDFQLQSSPTHKIPASDQVQISRKPLEAWVLSNKDEDITGKQKLFSKSLEKAALQSILALIEDMKANML